MLVILHANTFLKSEPFLKIVVRVSHLMLSAIVLHFKNSDLATNSEKR